MRKSSEILNKLSSSSNSSYENVSKRMNRSIIIDMAIENAGLRIEEAANILNMSISQINDILSGTLELTENEFKDILNRLSSRS